MPCTYFCIQAFKNLLFCRLTEILQFAEDMEIDIPKIWQYFGELIGPMVQDGSVPLNFLRKAAEPLKANNKAGLLVAEILHAASHREVIKSAILNVKMCFDSIVKQSVNTVCVNKATPVQIFEVVGSFCFKTRCNV